MNNKELTKKTQEIKEILNNHIEFGGEETPNYHRIVGYNELVATLADYITKTTQSNDEIKREAVESKAGQDFITALASERHTRDFVEFAKKHFMKDTDDFLTDGECAEMDIVLSRYLTQQSLDGGDE